MIIGFATLGIPFNGDSLNHVGLGGSETAVICMARELAKRGHQVYVFCRCEVPGVFDGVHYQDIGNLYVFNAEFEFDVFVCSRFWQILRKPIRAKLKLAWCHDMLVDPQTMQAALWQIDKVLLLSKFHIENYVSQIPDMAPLVWQTSNGVDMDLVKANLRPKVADKLIYTSRPERGLLTLLRDIFPALLERRPDLVLHVCSYDLAGIPTPPDVAMVHRECERLIDKLGPSVVRHGALTKARLYQEISSAELWLYPTDFPEISCIGAMEAQACGTWVVTTNCFALRETIQTEAKAKYANQYDDGTIPAEDRDKLLYAPAGRLIDGRPADSDYLTKFIDHCSMALKFGLDEQVQKNEREYGPGWILYAGFTWPQVASKWEAMMQAEIAAKSSIGKKLVVFANRSLRYDGDSLEFKGIGGSETAIICLARELAKLGEEVFVFCECARPGVYDGVTYRQVEELIEFNSVRKFDVFVACQIATILGDVPIRADMRIYWSQGLIWQMGGKEAVERMMWQTDRFLMVSNYQADSYRGVVPDKLLHVIRNGVDLDLIGANLRPKVTGKLIYSSKKERGLLYLLRDIFPELLEIDPCLTLHVCTYECPGFVVPADVKAIHDECDKLMLSLASRIVRHGALTKAELYQEISSAQAMLYPCEFEEAGCATVLEAQACGTPVITTDGYCMPEMASSMLAYRIAGTPTMPGYAASFIAAFVALGERLQRPMQVRYDREESINWIKAEGLTWTDLAMDWRAMYRDFLATKQGTPTLAACMIVKNEEADLYRCLRHVVPFVDELHIIVDDSTTDETEKIAAKFNPTTLRRVKFDNFAQMRNESIRDVKADWILWVDADEVLVGGENLRDMLSTKYFEGYVIRQRHAIFDAPNTEDAPIRLFRRRPHYKFTGYVHEHAEDTSKSAFDQQIMPAMMLAEVWLNHYGFPHEAIRREKASNRNMALLHRSAREQPERLLTWVMIERDYINIAKWKFEKDGGIVADSIEHQAICQAIEIHERKFGEETHRYHAMSYPLYQEALAMLSTFRLPAKGRSHPPLEVAFGMAGSVAMGGIPKSEKLEGRSRWFPDEAAFRAFIASRTDKLFSILSLPANASVVMPPEVPPDEILPHGTDAIPRRFAKDGNHLLAV